MSNFKSHFWYNKRQRNGILFLILLIAGLQIIYFFLLKDSTPPSSFVDQELQAQLDSLKAEQKQTPKDTIYPFNPNYLTDYKGYILGLTPEQLDNIYNLRAKGRFINSAKEFQAVTGIHDSLLIKLKPAMQFPQKRNQKEKQQITAKTNDLNKADVDDLKSVSGIGDKLAQRIIKYRTHLQGFTFPNQLYEVYYLDSLVANEVLNQFKIITKPTIVKTNINQATFKEVLKLPYTDYKITKLIFEYRDEVKVIERIVELKEIDSFPIEKYERIALYLTSE